MRHTLKGTGCIFGVTVECNLRPPSIQETDDILVCNIAHLVVLVYNFAVLVADSPIFGRHQRITSFIIRADVAVNARPSFLTLAVVALSHGPIALIIC